METYRLKVMGLEEIKRDIARLKGEGKRIVFTNGCFDILHPGHTRYLWAAKQLGDYLIIGVNSDRSVKTLKGPHRPVFSQQERTELLAALGFVDAVVLFDEDTPLKVIEYLMPDILVKGGDWPEEKIVGADIVKKQKGEVLRIPFISGYSTTQIIEKIKTK